MEIGVNRENDLKAVLVHYLGECVDCNVDNSSTCDVKCDDVAFSIKHVSGKPGCGVIKAKWTADTSSVEEHIKEMLLCKNVVNMIISYIDIKNNTVTIYLVDRQVISSAIEKFEERAFTTRTGKNNRGIEYSTVLIKHILSRATYTIKIKDDNEILKSQSSQGAISRRLHLLQQL
jgi:hypothetical protein